METGTVCGVRLDKGFFFVSVPGRSDVFAHCKELRGDLEFDEQLTGRRVQFDLVEGERGGRAFNIQAVE